MSSVLWNDAIKSWFPPNTTFKLVYKATRDGFTYTSFTKTCYNKGPTLAIIQNSDGDIFGGYNPESWSNSLYTSFNSASFLFKLTTLPQNLWNKFPLYNGEPVARYNQGYLFIFGDFDIAIAIPPLNSTVKFPSAYVDTAGNGICASKRFQVQEIEVFLTKSLV
jgi:TLD